MLKILKVNDTDLSIPQMTITKIGIKKLTNNAGIKSNGQITHYAPIKNVLTGKESVPESDQKDLPNLEFNEDGIVKLESVKEVKARVKEQIKTKKDEISKADKEPDVPKLDIEVLKQGSKNQPDYVKIKEFSNFNGSIRDIEGYHVGDFIVKKQKFGGGYELHHIPSRDRVIFFESGHHTAWDKKGAMELADLVTKSGLKELSDDNARDIFDEALDKIYYTPKLTDEQKAVDAKREQTGVWLKPESGLDVAVTPLNGQWRKVVGKRIGDYIIANPETSIDFMQDHYTAAEQAPMPKDLESKIKGKHYEVVHVPSGALLGNTKWQSFTKKQLEQFANKVSTDAELNSLLPKNQKDLLASNFDVETVKNKMTALKDSIK
jgi:hypothetical protein